MGLPIDHVVLLRQQDFVIPLGAGLNENERLLLLRYGRWLEALASGKLQPLTAEQTHFISVARDGATPSTAFERTWVKFLQIWSHATGSDSVGPLAVANRITQLAAARRAAASGAD